MRWVFYLTMLMSEALPQCTLPPMLPQVTLPPMSYQPALPPGAVEYHSDGFTQKVYETGGQSRIEPVPISLAKWRASGGLEGIGGWKSQKYRLIPEGKKVRTSIGHVLVLLSNGRSRQSSRSLHRLYPPGTEFHDVLTNTSTGKVFEHRVRKKNDDGKWEALIEYHDEAARPAGYTGLKVSCASCHNEAGTGGYNAGLVPGGDTVLSDPLDWTLVYGENYRHPKPSKSSVPTTPRPAQSPPGEGWQWDDVNAVWWRYGPTSQPAMRGRSFGFASSSC